MRAKNKTATAAKYQLLWRFSAERLLLVEKLYLLQAAHFLLIFIRRYSLQSGQVTFLALGLATGFTTSLWSWPEEHLPLTLQHLSVLKFGQLGQSTPPLHLTSFLPEAQLDFDGQALQSAFL